MSVRLEWLTANEVTAELLRRGDEADDHNEVTAAFAEVFGHPDGAVIEGSLPELRAMLAAPWTCSPSPNYSCPSTSNSPRPPN